MSAEPLPSLLPERHWKLAIPVGKAESAAELAIYEGEGRQTCRSVSFPRDQFLQQFLTSSVAYHLPIVLLLDEAGEIEKMGTVTCGEVLDVTEGREYASIAFGGEACPRYLTPRSPNYEELLALLFDAQACAVHRWYAFEGSTLVEILSRSPEETDAITAWIHRLTKDHPIPLAYPPEATP